MMKCENNPTRKPIPTITVESDAHGAASIARAALVVLRIKKVFRKKKAKREKDKR